MCFGAMALTRAVASGMIERGSGSIIFITSMAALFGIPEVAAYSAAKSATLGLVRSLAVEWSPRGVRVNAIAPGWIETPMSHQALDNDPDRKQKDPRANSDRPAGHTGGYWLGGGLPLLFTGEVCHGTTTGSGWRREHRILMKIGLGLYRHQLNREHYDFARQCGATHLVVHLVDYFRQSGRNPKSNQPTGDVRGWGLAGDPDQLWSVEELSSLKEDINAAGLNSKPSRTSIRPTGTTFCSMGPRRTSSLRTSGRSSVAWARSGFR